MVSFTFLSYLHIFSSNSLLVGNSLEPKPRSGHRIVVDEDYIYVFGGFNSSITSSNVQADVFELTKPLFKELWRFSKLTRTWQNLPCTGDVPNALVSAGLIMLNRNYLLTFGGSGFPFGSNNSNDVHICDLRTLEWTEVMCDVGDDFEPENPLPGYGQAVVLDRDNRILYVCGGTDGGNYNCDVHQLHIPTKKWTLLYRNYDPDLGRYRHEMALYKGSLYLIGGGTSNNVIRTNSVIFSYLLLKFPLNFVSLSSRSMSFISKAVHGQYKKQYHIRNRMAVKYIHLAV